MSTLTLLPIKDINVSSWSNIPSITSEPFCASVQTSNADTSYIKCSTVPYNTRRYALFEFEPPAAYGTVNSVTIHMVAAKYSGSPEIGALLYLGDTYYEGTAQIPSSSSYIDYTQTYSTNPATGLAWTWDDIICLQAGVWGMTPTNTNWSKVTQCYAVIDYNALTFYSATLRPSGAGDLTQLVPSSGSNYACVDEVTINDDVDYVTTPDTSAYSDLYNLQNSSVGRILFVAVYAACRNSSGSTGKKIRPMIKTNSVLYYGQLRSLGTISSYIAFCGAWKVNPNAGITWTQSDVDALQAGVELDGSATYIRCTQVYVVVGYYIQPAAARAQLIGFLG